MRMMLLAYLLCSLALAEAGGNPATVAPKPTPATVTAEADAATTKAPEMISNSKLIADCNDDIYECYVLESCRTGTIVALEKDKPKKIESSERITENCPFIVKLFLFNEHKDLHLSIKSTDAATKSIAFIKDGNKNEGHLVKLSCEVDANGKLNGTFAVSEILEIATETEPAKTEQIHAVVRNIPWDSTKPIECVFDVKAMPQKVPKDPKDVFRGATRADKISFEINGIKSYYKQFYINNNARCNPLLFTFNIEEDILREKSLKFMYEKIKPVFGTIPTCDAGYELEYRRDNNQPSVYEKVPAGEPKCVEMTNFQINGQKLPDDESIFIRCKAKTSCAYVVKHSAGDNKKRVEGIDRLKCPTSHPYLEIKNRIVEESHDTIECINYEAENKAFWMIDGMALRASGPEVNCLDIYECHRKRKISPPKFGELIDHIPTCPKEKGREGKLKLVGKEEKSDAEVHVFCNNKTGDLMYNAGEGDVLVGDAKFVCKFPTIKDEKEDAKNALALKVTVATTLGISFGVAAAIIGLVFALSFFRVYLLKKQMVKQHKKEWHAFAINKKEKKRLKKLKAAANPDGIEPKSDMSILQPVEDLGKINPLILAGRLRARNLMKIEAKPQKVTIAPRHADVSQADAKAAYDVTGVNKKIYALDLGDLKTDRQEKMDAAFREDFHAPDSEDAKEPEDNKKK